MCIFPFPKWFQSYPPLRDEMRGCFKIILWKPIESEEYMAELVLLYFAKSHSILSAKLLPTEWHGYADESVGVETQWTAVNINALTKDGSCW
jgi:hypothetical protein